MGFVVMRVAVRLQVVVIARDALESADNGRMIEDLPHEGDTWQQVVARIALLGKNLLMFCEDLVVKLTWQIWRDRHRAVGDELRHLRIVETEGLVCHLPAA
jgi:hypothetical protein